MSHDSKIIRPPEPSRPGTRACGRECGAELVSPFTCAQCCDASWPAVLGSSLFGLFRTTVEGRLLCASEGLAAILGYENSDEMLALVKDMARDVYADPEERHEHMARSLASPETISREMRWKRKDGSIVWVRSDKIIVRDEKGAVLYQEGVISDITAHKRAEDQLRASEARFRSLFEGSVDAIYLLDQDGRIREANAVGHTLMGAAPGSLVGRPFTDLCSPAACVRIENVLHSVRGGGRARFRFDMKRPDGTTLRVDAGVSEVPGTPGVIQAVCRDITPLVEAQRRLGDALAELETIFENSQVGVMLVGEEYLIRRANSRLGDIFGYQPDDLEGRDVSLLHPNLECFLAFRDELTRHMVEKGQFQGECEMRRRDGSQVWCQIWGRALDRSNLSRGMIWVVDDITARKAAEELRQEVERIARHDLKSPLGAVISYPAIIAEEGDLTPEQRDDLERIRQAGFRMLEMVNLSLDLFKMEQGTYVLKSEEIDLLAVLERVLWEVNVQASARNVSLGVLVEGRAPEKGERFAALGEDLLCSSMLANLIKNAIEASPRHRKVTVALAAEGSEAVISIHNAGAIAETILPRFAQKYATHGKPNGTGLGAYSARLMAEVQHGSLSFTSSEAEGTTLTVRLPRPA
ncbi:PAS/PAC sensor signal transduction histidine kinase [Desulfovibrio sp. X2]|uniref:PAS domain-containing sensor histidine kinase n=1 Tax=Desulfovibrio sp. X2 TaxID=941449 RepID=UPI0003589FC9|nr:PAS domain-containing sensor histidine kinase [Desulfovibrio sp. X2]EPR36335.1 PAS/PAC sensor signal transduction histidine kinase [Desulfovibrio sp. X2]